MRRAQTCWSWRENAPGTARAEYGKAVTKLHLASDHFWPSFPTGSRSATAWCRTWWLHPCAYIPEGSIAAETQSSGATIRILLPRTRHDRAGSDTRCRGRSLNGSRCRCWCWRRHSRFGTAQRKLRHGAVRFSTNHAHRVPSDRTREYVGEKSPGVAIATDDLVTASRTHLGSRFETACRVRRATNRIDRFSCRPGERFRRGLAARQKHCRKNQNRRQTKFHQLLCPISLVSQLNWRIYGKGGW